MFWESRVAVVTHLQQQLHDVPMDQTQHGLSVHVCDEISCPQPGLLRRAPLLHALQPKQRGFIWVPASSWGFPTGKGTTRPQGTYPDHVVDSVDVAVAHVDADGSQGEAVLLPRAVDDDGRPQAGDGQRGVSARGGVPGRGVGREGVRGDGAHQGTATKVICKQKAPAQPSKTT